VIIRTRPNAQHVINLIRPALRDMEGIAQKILAPGGLQTEGEIELLVSTIRSVMEALNDTEARIPQKAFPVYPGAQTEGEHPVDERSTL